MRILPFLLRRPSTVALTLVIGLSVLASVPVATEAAPAAASARQKASLVVTPNVYVGGQRLSWVGSVGHPGVRALELQFNMGVATGGNWSTVDGFHARTRPNGSFSFSWPAPSMFNIRYRVKAGRFVTPARLFAAKTQDLTVRVAGQPVTSTNLPAMVLPAQKFGISVDTTPDNIFRSPESRGLPVFEGRALTLQKRADDSTWRTVSSTKVGGNGLADFSGLTGTSGVTVYRVRQENYFTGGHEIGWTQSFPLYVLAGAEGMRWLTDHYGDLSLRQATAAPATTRPTGRIGRQPETASQHYSWFPSVFDFAWEYGQSLSSRPSRGSDLRGSWVDSSTGTGRVSKYNGGLSLDSKRYAGPGLGDFGTTTATLQGNALTQGRWETSLRVRNTTERSGRDYDLLAELVPAKASDYDCGAHNITIASISPYSKRMQFGVRSKKQEWSGSASAPYTPLTNAYNVAVEVTSSHITWFLNGSAVASVTNAEAIPSVPLTLRLSVRGDGDKEMNQTGLISDWQRGFPADTGKQTVSKKKLSASTADTACE